MSYNDIIVAANLYLDGLSLREIASKLNFSHVTIRYNLLKSLKDLDFDLWCQVLEKINEKKNANSIALEEVRKRILLAYKLLVENNKTILEIASMLNSTEFTIYRDLTKRLELLQTSFPDTVNAGMVKNVQDILEKHRIENLKKDEGSIHR